MINKEGNSLSNSTDYYSETITGYDKVGNIQGLRRRYNNTEVDSMTYKYNAIPDRILLQ